MVILRDKGRITEMMILLSMLKGNKKLKEIAMDVDITVQGVSEYMKILEANGWVREGNITPAGMEFLYTSVEEIGDFLHSATKLIGKIRVTEAIAGEDLEEGDEVGLVMENGYIHAYKRKSSSMGISVINARKGEDVGVKDLRGIMDIKYGDIEVYVMPPIEEGGSRIVDIEKLKKLLSIKKNRKIGVFGIVPYVTMKKISTIDFDFGSVNAAIDASFRGVKTMLFVSHELLPYTLQLISERGVKYEVKNVKDL